MTYDDDYFAEERAYELFLDEQSELDEDEDDYDRDAVELERMWRE